MELTLLGIDPIKVPLFEIVVSMCVYGAWREACMEYIRCATACWMMWVVTRFELGTPSATRCRGCDRTALTWPGLIAQRQRLWPLRPLRRSVLPMPEHIPSLPTIGLWRANHILHSLFNYMRVPNLSCVIILHAQFFTDVK